MARVLGQANSQDVAEEEPGFKERLQQLVSRATVPDQKSDGNLILSRGILCCGQLRTLSSNQKI